MKLRFQIGSKRPLANRNARMFWAASLPRKWSIRKICSSRKTSCTSALSATADARSVPNGFSMMIRDRSTRPGRLELVDHVERGLGRDAEVVEAAYVARRRPARPRPRAPGRDGLAAGRLRDVAEQRRERRPPLVGDLALAELLAGRPGELVELLVVEVLHRGADDPGVVEQVGLGQPQQPGQQLAAGQVAGRAEQHDDVRLGHVLDGSHEVLPRYYRWSLRGSGRSSARSSRSAFHRDSAYSSATSERTVMPPPVPSR